MPKATKIIDEQWRNVLVYMGPDFTQAEWAERIGCHVNTVSRACRAHGLPTKGRATGRNLAAFVQGVGAKCAVYGEVDRDRDVSSGSNALREVEPLSVWRAN